VVIGKYLLIFLYFGRNFLTNGESTFKTLAQGGSYKMFFNQYREILDKISRLDKPLSSLSRSQRNEVLNLSVRQEELEKQIGDKIRAGFKELRDNLTVVGEWVSLMEEEAIKSLGVEGTPEEVLALEETLTQVSSLNSQISAITLANFSAPIDVPINNPETPEAKVMLPKPVVPLPVSSIDMEEEPEKEDIVTKVLEEISESVTAAAPSYQPSYQPTYLPEVFNEPRITVQKNRPIKRKRR